MYVCVYIYIYIYTSLSLSIYIYIYIYIIHTISLYMCLRHQCLACLRVRQVVRVQCSAYAELEKARKPKSYPHVYQYSIN